MINNKIYIGCHKTEDLKDGYMGSGKILKRSIVKYGIENFSKKYLQIFDNPEEMFEMELKLVNADFITEASNYNLKVGGEGSFDYINSMGGQGKRLNDNLSNEKRMLGSINGKDNRVKSVKSGHKNGKYNDNYFGNCEWQDKAIQSAQSEKAMEKRKETYKKMKFQQGENNSQYGTHWYCNEEVGIDGRKRYKNGDQPNGWITTTEYRKLKK